MIEPKLTDPVIKAMYANTLRWQLCAYKWLGAYVPPAPPSRWVRLRSFLLGGAV